MQELPGAPTPSNMHSPAKPKPSRPVSKLTFLTYWQVHLRPHCVSRFVIRNTRASILRRVGMGRQLRVHARSGNAANIDKRGDDGFVIQVVRKGKENAAHGGSVRQRP